MAIELTVHPRLHTVAFEREQVVRLGRDRSNEVIVGRERVHGKSTVSKHHAELQWDGSRWSTRNVSDKAGLLRVYEPGFEEVPLAPGRPWVPVRHRWCLSFGRPDHPFHVVCRTDDHRIGVGRVAGAPGGADGAAARGDDDLRTVEPDADPFDDDDPTAALDPTVALPFTPLELEALLAYYGEFSRLPRPAVLAPRSHEEAAGRLGRTKDSTRKAIERANDKMGRILGAPAIATGRNVSPEIGRWLAQTGLLDLDDRAGNPAGPDGPPP